MYLPFELMQLSITLLAAALLVSSLKDVFLDLKRIDLLERDVESITGPYDDFLVHNLGLFDVHEGVALVSESRVVLDL